MDLSSGRQLCGCCGKLLRDGGCPDCMECEHLPCCHGVCWRWKAFCEMWTDVVRCWRGKHPAQLFGAQLRGVKITRVIPHWLPPAFVSL